MKNIFFIIFCINSLCASGQQALIANIDSRNTINLNGKWQYIVDPYGTGFYDYRYKEKNISDKDAYWNNDIPDNKTDRREYGYSDSSTLNVPGDWNSQDPKFLYYEGIVWYKKKFDMPSIGEDKKVFIYFGAVNYFSDIYLNGKKLGEHKGGFTPFNFEIPINLLKAKDNFIIVKVDNKRGADEVPTLNTDWWNYGGITRDVKLVIVPTIFIENYAIQLIKPIKHSKIKTIGGWIKLNTSSNEHIVLSIPELGLKKEIISKGDTAAFNFAVPKVMLWSTDNPKLYTVKLTTRQEDVTDKIGFRSIETNGHQLILNGNPLFLRGICVHEEVPGKASRANSKEDALLLLNQVRELHGNMVRLAHYPHNENMVRMADSLGILVWSEIPVYWTINFTSPEVLQKATQQLTEMIGRDRNRASIIIWSVGNETPVGEARTKFMSSLIKTARSIDSSRLLSAALQSYTKDGITIVDDPLGEFTDLVSVNEYIGWYDGLPTKCRTTSWKIKYDKPLFFSETGAEALGGFHADSLTVWSEEYQEWYYKEQVAMMEKLPANFVGLSPWILNDFRSPRRNNPTYQNGWNNKGLYDQHLRKKKAFYILQAYYTKMAEKYKVM